MFFCHLVFLFVIFAFLGKKFLNFPYLDYDTKSLKSNYNSEAQCFEKIEELLTALKIYKTGSTMMGYPS